MTVGKLAVSAAFFALVFRMTGREEMGAIVDRVDPVFVILSVVMSFAMVLVSCWKWRVLLGGEAPAIPFQRLVRFYLTGYYFTCLLPSNIGGDVVRSFYAGRDVGDQARSGVSVFLERFTGLIFLLMLVIAAPMLDPSLYRSPAIFIPAVGALCLLILLVLLSRFRQPLKSFSRLLGEDRASGGAGLVDRFRRATTGLSQKLKKGLHSLRRDPGVFWPVVLLTVGFYLLTWINVYLSFRAFGVTVGLAGIVAVLPAAMMVAMMPVAPLAGLGLSEFSYVFYFGLVGVDSEVSLAMGLLLRAKLLLLGLLGLLCHVTLCGRVERYDEFRAKS